MEEKQKKIPWNLINWLIFALHFFTPFCAMALMYTTGISMIVFPLAVLASLAVGGVHKLVMQKQKGKKALHIVRGLAITLWVVFYLPTVILMNFQNTKLMYPVKRLVYIGGVYSMNSYRYRQLLPEKLPKVCEDYSFRTQGGLIAQDYHASSYLMFHTDTAGLDALAAYHDYQGHRRIVNSPDSEEAQDKINWFCGQMRMENYFQDDLSNAVLYWYNDYYPKGVLLNYETGLVAILT